MKNKNRNLQGRNSAGRIIYSLAATLFVFLMPRSQAQTTIIKANTTTMAAATDWTPNGIPNNLSIGCFDNTISSGNEGALTLGGNVTLAGLLFTNNLNGPVNITDVNMLTLDGSLISGDTGIDMSTANQSVSFNVPLTLIGSQAWKVAAGQTLTIGSTLTTAGAGVNFTGFAGTLGTFTGDGSGILGPWATIGSGAALNYATVSGGVVSAYTGGAAAATAAGLTDTSGTTNYNLAAAAGAIPSIFSGNTIRYTGTAATTVSTAGSTSFIINGLMNVGTGTWTIGADGGVPITIGVDRNFEITGNTNTTTIFGPIIDNPAGISTVTYNGIGTLILGNKSGSTTTDNSSTFTNNLVINSGVVSVQKGVNVNAGATANSSPLGSRSVARNVIVNNGAILSFDLSNETGRGGGSGPGPLFPQMTLVVNKGGIIRATTGNRTFGPLQLNGGIVTNGAAIAGSAGGSSGYQGMAFSTNVTVGGTSPSFILGGGINLAVIAAYSQANVNVADTTGNPNVDLTVSSVLANVLNSTVAAGLTKSGAGTMLLTASNYYTGPTIVSAGTLMAGVNSLAGVTGAFGDTSGTIVLGDTNTAANNSSAALLTGGAFTIGRMVLITNQSTTGTYTIGGYLDTNSTFSGLITMEQPLTISQAADPGANALTISGGITNAGGTQTLTFAGPGNVNVTSAISDGGTLAVNITGGTNVFSAANVYSGGTTVANAKLLVNGSIAGNLTGNSGAFIGGSGFISGSVTMNGGSHTLPGSSGLTNTIGSSLTYNSGSEADFYLSSSATIGANGQIDLNGNGTLGIGSGINVGIICSSNLDISGHSYVLFNLTGGGTISGSFNPMPVWLGATPNLASDYTVVNTGTQILLQFTGQAGPAINAASVTPDPALRNQPVIISVTVNQGSAPITSVKVDASPIGGSSTLTLVADGAGDYTNTVTVPAATSADDVMLNVTATDGNSLSASAEVPLTISASTEVWNGGAGVNNWSSNPNWVSGFAPGLSGDSLVFDGITRLTPLLDNNYNIGTLIFDSTAGSFNISGSAGDNLTLTGGLTNNSVNAETVNVPVVLSAPVTVSALAGNLTLGQNITNGGNLLTVSDGGFNTVVNGGLFGTGGLTKNGAGTNIISGNSSSSGLTIVNAGTLVLAGINVSNLTTVANGATLQLANPNAVTGTLALKNGSTLQLRGDNNTTFTNSGIVLDIAADTNNFDVNSLTGATGKTLTLAGALTFLNSSFQEINVTGNSSYTLALGDIAATSATSGGQIFDINALSGSANVTINSFTAGNWDTYLNLTGGGGVTFNGYFANTSNGGVELFVNDGTTVTLKGTANPTGVNGNFADPYNYIVQNGTLVIDSGAAITNNSNGPKVSNFILGASSYQTTNSIIGINSDNSFNGTVYLGDTNFPNGGITVAANVTNIVADGGFDVQTFNSFVNSGIFTIGGQNTSGTNTYANPIILGSSTPTLGGFYGGQNVTVVATAGGEVDFTGGILQNGDDTTAVVTVGDPNHTGLVKFSGITDTYPNGTTVAYGRLLVNNTIGTGSSTVTVNSGAKLGGNGIILDSVTVQNGGILHPGLGNGDTSALTVNNSLTLAGTTVFTLNRANTPNSSEVTGITTLNMGGTLTVTNAGAALQSGDTFTLFNASTYNGSFSITNLPALSPGLSWSNSIAVNGAITVFGQSTTPPNPPTIGNVNVAFGNITFSGINGIAGQQYRILMTTNLTLPLASWIPVATNMFASDGGYTNSIPVQVNQLQGYFRLVTP